ncbi:ATP-binding protein [Nocardioides bruguierae]|uniref:ATP-binding protein n=1 Tax=Nocardioides bruguierae TaxID=2945102 RepID=UPI00202209C0|nr:ATP-binding protein [Nocardioides bruguierae]MCL8025709.1 ATP-binding protein [Nocardioides bruguierae]
MISGVTAGSRTPLLMGRNRELARIEAAAREGRPVLVRGRAGVGVSAVLQEVARRLEVSGRRPGRGAGSPWAEVGTDVDITPASARDLIPLAARRGTSLVVDDADLCSPEELRLLAETAWRSSVSLVLGAHADVPLVSQDPSASVIDLDGLDRASVAHLASSLRGEVLDADGGAAACLQRACAGNPGRLTALLDLPEINDLLVRAADTEDPEELAPEFAGLLERSVLARVGALTLAGQTALAVVLVAGPHAPLALVQGAAGHDGLDEVLASGLLVQVEAETPEPRHGAVGRLLTHTLPWQLRAEAQRLLGVAAERTGLALVRSLPSAVTATWPA